jgi:transcription elongation regulator 1
MENLYQGLKWLCNSLLCRSSFSDFAQKHGKDERFRNIEKMRERESLFNEYLLDVRKREKEEKVMRREQVRLLGT